jgi:predicted O-linked N-acetylglucosamine transferase (SPINDLY family)
MGVPVVTLVGRRHAERTSYSILANLGVTETVAQSGREYVEIAVRLADDAAFMASVRAAIRGTSPIRCSPTWSDTRGTSNPPTSALTERCPEVVAAASSDDV